MIGLRGVYAVGVPVRDQDRALAFYIDVLGLRLRRDVPSDELAGRWIEVAPSGAATTIALVPERDDLRCGSDTGIRLGVTDAETARAELLRRGVEAGQVGGCAAAPPTFVIRDQDGNSVMLVEHSGRDSGVRGR
ncbi:MAG TPA: VOC family protein [Conexibacter sp.]|nr:VOC family protein [Conexibacter sp.]